MYYVELHSRSAFTFLEGASLPEMLAQTCATQQMSAMALLDRNGVYGAPRFYSQAKKCGIKAHVGAEVTVAGYGNMPVLVRSRAGYQNLCRLITSMKLRSKNKAAGCAFLEEVGNAVDGLICLSGDEHGPLAISLQRGGMEEGRRCLHHLVSIFGAGNVYVELQRHCHR